MQPSKIRQVTVFGNPIEKNDNLVVNLLPELHTLMPGIDFVVADPTENVEPLSEPWVILDVGVGIEEVVVVEDLSELEFVQGQSVHDFDVYMELRLKDKLGMLPKLRIIIVPNAMKPRQALLKICRVLGELL